jgi:hypothetical protein
MDSNVSWSQRAELWRGRMRETTTQREKERVREKKRKDRGREEVRRKPIGRVPSGGGVGSIDYLSLTHTLSSLPDTTNKKEFS